LLFRRASARLSSESNNAVEFAIFIIPVKCREREDLNFDN
jgi:hypothetical protein